VSAWQVLGTEPVASRFAAQRQHNLTPLVGRDAEFARLWRSWREACTEQGRVVLLTGEPGIGKSRLSEELMGRIEGEPNIRLRHFCSPYHASSALFPFINRLERTAGFEPGDAPRRKLEKLEALLALSSAHSEHSLAVLADLLSLPTAGRYSLPVESPRERRERVFTVMIEQLARAAGRAPVLVVIEDLHWIDPTSEELLTRLVELAAQWRVLLLLTARLEYAPPWRALPHVETIPLSGLDGGNAALIISGVTGGRRLPNEVVEPILERAEGVPLFIEEVTKAVLESGLLRPGAKGFALAGPLPSLAIPDSLEASLLARLDRLSPVLEVAQAGAAFGRNFFYATLRAVLNRSDVELEAALLQLVNAQIIRQRGVPPDAEYMFSHALLRDVAYGMMVGGKRQRLHAQIVQALESEFADTVETEPQLLALHCTNAELIDKAVDYWLRAGTRAVTRSANREAIDHLCKGIALLPRLAEGPQRARHELTMQLTLGHASIAVNGYSHEMTARAYARAGELFEYGDLDQRIGILFGTYFGHLMGGRLERGAVPLQRLFALARQSGDCGYICLVHRVLGTLALYRGALTEARSHLEEAIELYDHARHSRLTFRFGSHVRISAQAWLSVTLWLLGLPDSARCVADEAVAAARRFGHTHTLGHVLGLVTHVYAELPDLATLSAVSAEGAEFCERHRLGFFGPWLRFMQLWAEAHDIDPDRYIRPMRDALSLYEATHTKLMRPYFRSILGRALLLAGRPEEAAEEIEIALQNMAATGEDWWRPEIQRLRAECLLALPQPDAAAAETCLRQAIATAQASEAKSLVLRAATGLARLLSAQRRSTEMRTLLTPLLDAADEGRAAPEFVAARRLLDASPAAP
jgi:predicted ATPase